MDNQDLAEMQSLLSRISELEEQLHAAHDFAASASDWFWESDADGRFTYLSPHFAGSFGEEPSTYIGKTRDDVALKYYDDEVAGKIFALIKQRKPFRDLQFQRRTIDGDLVWARSSGVPKFDAFGNFTGYRGAGANVTDLISLSQRRDELAALVDTAPFGLLVLDHEQRVKIVNRRLREIVGEFYGQLSIGKTHAEIAWAAIRNGIIDPSPQTPEAWVEQRVATVSKAPAVQERKLGDRWYEIHSEPFTDGSVLMHYVDVTTRRNLQEQLAHKQRIESIGRLTAGVAHDFNNLLAVILGNLELLNPSKSVAESQDLIDSAINATLKGAGLTRQLLAFGRKSALMPEVVDANTVIQEMMELFDRTLPATIPIETELSSDLKLANIDRGQLEQALLNLVINSRDAMPSGGKITIRTKRARLDEDHPSANTAGIEPGCFVLIEVSDTGEGMSPETAQRAFEPFFTTKPVGEGSGLGLSMVIGFAQQSGGDAQIQSELGSGTTISMYFPATGHPTADAESASLGADHPPQTQKHVLLVEDNQDVRSVMAANLRQLGYQITEAHDGEAGLDAFKTLEQVDLILADAVMPGKTQGPELVRLCQHIKPELKALLVSGYPFLIDQNDFLEGLSVRVLMKPVLRDTLAREIEDLLD